MDPTFYKLFDFGAVGHLTRLSSFSVDDCHISVVLNEQCDNILNTLRNKVTCPCINIYSVCLKDSQPLNRQFLKFYEVTNKTRC